MLKLFRQGTVGFIAWLDLAGAFFSLRMILKDSSSTAQQEPRDDNGEQTAGGRTHDNPSVKLKTDDKNKHDNNGHSALPEDAERKRSKEQPNNESDDDKCEPRRRGSLKPSQPGR